MLTKLVERMHHIKRNSRLPRVKKKPSGHSEQGIALLGTTVVLALVMGLLVWGTLVMTRQSAISAYQVNNANQARTAALIGISALEQYAQNKYQPPAASTTSTTGGNSNPISNGFGSLLTSSSTAPATSGPGAVAAYVPVGTNAATSITFSAPYMAATVSAVVTANTFSVSPSPNGTAGQIIIIASQGASGSARATAVAVLGVPSPGSSAGSAQGNIPVNLSGDTSFSGDINLIGGSNSSLSTSGNLTSSGSFTGFNTIISTQSMNLSGSSGAGNLFSDQSITITGSGNYGSIKSLENVTLGSSVNAQIIQTNGTTTLGSSTQATTITSIGDVTLGSTSSVSNLSTQGSVTADDASVGTANVQNNYSESSSGSAASGEVGGTITVPSWNHNVKLTQNKNLVVNITPLTAATISQPTVDASAMESLANYAFTPPPSGSAPGIIATVVVKNVNGIPSSTYFLYDNGGTNDYLVTSNSQPTTFGAYKIGTGYSSHNPDINYSDGTWTLEGNTGSTSDIAPGVLWFSGNVDVADGTYYNSIIATGNITTAGSSQVYAVNYAGGTKPPQNVCTNTGYSTGGIVGIGATTINPSNFCGTSSSSTFNPASVGNIALLAGGDVTLGASIVVYGDVIAGDVINTSGSSTIYGYLTSAGMVDGTPSGEPNSFGGSTTVNVQNLPSTFTPTVPVTWSSTAPAASTTSSLVLLSLYWE